MLPLRVLLEGDGELMTAASKLVMETVRKYTCEHCGAGQGEPCVAPSSGRPQILEHKSRYDQARAAGDIPIDLGDFY